MYYLIEDDNDSGIVSRPILTSNNSTMKKE